MVDSTPNNDVGLYVKDPSQILKQAWEWPNPGVAIVGILEEIRQQYPNDLGRVTLSVWSEVSGRARDARFKISGEMYGDRQKCSAFHGFYGLSIEETLALNRRVSQETRVEQEILGVIREFKPDQQYQNPGE